MGEERGTGSDAPKRASGGIDWLDFGHALATRIGSIAARRKLIPESSDAELGYNDNLFLDRPVPKGIDKI